MASSMTNARENRQSVRIFDVDLFRNKLENFMRKQAEEMCEMVNNKKRKYSDRWSEIEKEDLDLSEDYRDDSVFQFGKRQRGDSYYPIDDDELDMEEVSPLALPSPVSLYAGEPTHQSYFDNQPPTAIDEEADSMSMAMRRQVTGYSEATTAYAEDDNDWMSPCPPLSRASLSSSSSMPDTPNHGAGSSTGSDYGSYDHDGEDEDQFMPQLDHLDLDLATMEPHERTLLAALAPERFEKAALIKKAFRRSDKVLSHLVRESQSQKPDQDTVMAMHMDDGEYDQVFGELMQI